jgi:hypothetical protein
LKEFVENSVSRDRPNLVDIYEIGKSMGLNEEDIINFHRRNRSNGLRSFLARYWYLFLPVIAFAAIVIMYFLISGPGSPTNTYPPGSRYNVINTKEFRKRGSP